MKISGQEIKCRIGMAAAVAVTLFAGLLLFYRHWQFEMPLYPNVDEQLSLDCIFDLLNQHIYAGDIYVLDFFRYPHFTFYYAVSGVRILGKLLSGTDTIILLRYVVCGTAVLSNVCIYFSVKRMTGERKWAFVALVLSVFSLYGYAYLYYTGPDTMIYAVANVIMLLGCMIYQDENKERVVYLWYPLMAICIGLATASKVHGILFGVFWLALHIKKKYWKSYRNNFLFLLDCILLAMVFCLCNYSMFFHFKTFVWDNLYNLNHYAWGHPGIEHNFPLLGYFEAYALTGYGVVGGILFVIGIVSLIRRKDWQKAVVFLLMPLGVILFLSRYQIVLGRNLSLVQPFFFLFMVYGLMEVKGWMSKCKRLRLDRKWVIPALIALMVVCNGSVAVNSYRYELTYTQAAEYINAQIPEGATIYSTSFAPAMDTERYTVIDIGEDISLLPDALEGGEYYVDTEYATGYFGQKKDYLIIQGDEMYPDLKAAYEAKTGNYTKLQSYTGISYGKEWKYRIGYLDMFRYSPKEYYVGPTIMIYGQ
ncbi:MAG: glycosyltransferase family 39 protein [Lachnospiraceae bacterium]|nr:glycosyltransferase family 39 protein [Lachnospiraceae bacterium]